MVEYTFLKQRRIGKNRWGRYSMTWGSGISAGNTTRGLVGHLISNEREINLKEDTFNCPVRSVRRGVIEEGASVRDLNEFYRIGKERGIVG